jgi:drug/metabolite transporter (DMT)-like permease
VAVRFSNRGIPPLFGAGFRFLLASVLLFAWIGARRIRLPARSELPGTVLFGLLGFAGFFAFGYWALVYLPAGVAGVLVASVPLLTVLLAGVHRLEPVTVRGLGGATVAIAGIGMMLGMPSATNVALGPALAVLAAAAADAEATVVVKKLPTGHPVSTNAVAMLTGAVVLLGLSALYREPWRLPGDPAILATFVYLVTLGSILLFVLFVWTVKRWTATGMSYMFVLMPVVAAILGALLLDEPVTLPTVIGGLIVLAGVYIGALSGETPALATSRRR